MNNGAERPVVTIIGGGLAGSEAAWQAARLGVAVELYEMRPVRQTPAHHTDRLAELVCSNSLGGQGITTGGGLLKEEMARLGSLIVAAGRRAHVPAGGALAVDRHIFADVITSALERHPLITIRREEVTRIPGFGDEGEAGEPGGARRPVIIATGPLTSEALSRDLRALTGDDDLYFYDAAAPIVSADSIIEERGFWGSRYGRGGDDYFNCPLTKEEYEAFWDALVEAEHHEGHLEEELKFFEGCVPVEELAARGPDTLRFGPMRPVGLVDPRTGERPYAVVQLRRENVPTTMMSLVGFQTRLKWGEQKRVFSMIPALEQAEFVRLGVMHRNTFINSPRVLQPTYQTRTHPHIFVAGQLTGVEGYVESAAAGLVAGINASRIAQGLEPLTFPRETMMGSLAHFITTADPRHFQPMNSNFGLLPPLARPPRKKSERKEAAARIALAAMEAFAEGEGLALDADAALAELQLSAV